MNHFNINYHDFIRSVLAYRLNKTKSYKLKQEQKQVLSYNHIKVNKAHNQQNKKLIKYISLQH